MDYKSDAELQAGYRDIIGEDRDERLFAVVRELDADYKRFDLPPERTMPVVPALHVAPVPEVRRRRWRLPLALVALASILLCAGVVVAASGILNLGKPSNVTSTNAYFPLSGFHRMPTSLRRGTKPEVLFLGAQGAAFSVIGAERWPVVKALSQFGSFSEVREVDRTCTSYYGGVVSNCNVPTYDFTHASYTSRYIAFVSRDLIRSSGYLGLPAVPLQRLSREERALFEKYVQVRGTPRCERLNFQNGRYTGMTYYRCHGYTNTVWASIIDSKQDGRTLPLIAIGNYLQTSSEDMTTADDFFQTDSEGRSQPYTFAQIQQALMRDVDPGSGSHVVENVNAEANIMIALICHADGLRPGSVCGRPTIKQILVHVR